MLLMFNLNYVKIRHLAMMTKHVWAPENLLLVSIAFLAFGSMIALTFNELSVATSEPEMFVSPSSIAVNVDQTFEVDINVSGVSDLYGWEFKLGWNSSLLEALNVTENSFLGMFSFV